MLFKQSTGLTINEYLTAERIRHAKELLMDVNRMTEEEAHRFLQKRSMDTGARLTDTAQAVIDAYR